MSISLPSARSRALMWRDEGSKPLGLIVGGSDPAIIVAMAIAGFSFAILDNEHSPLDPASALEHVRVAEAVGLTPLARVGKCDQLLVQKFLDVGCQGVVFPRVNSPEMAVACVETLRFAPRGGRGMCTSTHGAAYGGHDWSIYARTSEAETLCILLIETIEGVEAIESIVSVDGVDVIYFGIGDLSVEYGDGVGWESQQVRVAWRRVRGAAAAKGKLIMTSPHPEVSPAAVRGLFDDGADLITYSADGVLVAKLLTEIVRQVGDKQ